MSEDYLLIKQYQNGEITQRELANHFYPKIKRIARVIANRMAIDKDDLIQELWILFVEKIVPRYVDDKNLLDAYIYGYAKKRAMHFRWEHNKEVSFTDLTGGSALQEDDGVKTIDEFISSMTGCFNEIDENLIHANIRCQSLLDKSAGDASIFSKLPGISERLYSDDFTKDLIAKEISGLGFSKNADVGKLIESINILDLEKKNKVLKSKKIENNFTENHTELRSIRIKCNKTKKEFASLIGILVPTLDAYEYGRTKSVPESVMASARQWLSNYTDEFSGVRARFKNMKMSAILKVWTDEIGMDYEDCQELASIFMVTKTTVKRWMTDESMPTLEKIDFLNSRVKSFIQESLNGKRAQGCKILCLE